MGMHSWVCKGCKLELNSGEYIRLDGHKQVYDGYGGGRSYGDDLAGWHQYCYSKATVEQKLDEEPSESAPNQGMGEARLQFKEGYDENAETKYSAVIFGREYFPETQTGTDWQFYLTENGIEDQIAYQKALENAYETLNREDPNWCTAVLALPYDSEGNAERNKRYTERTKQALDRVGASPRTRTKTFSTLDECLAAIEPHLPSVLPDVRRKELVIYGTQENADGVVYEKRLEKE